MTTLGTQGRMAAAPVLIVIMALGIPTVMAHTQDNARPANLQAAEVTTQDSQSLTGSSYTLASSSEKAC